MNNCSRYRTPWQRPAEAGEPAYAVVGSKHYTQVLAQSTSRWHGRVFRSESPRRRFARSAATANILSVAGLPSERHVKRGARPALGFASQPCDWFAVSRMKTQQALHQQSAETPFVRACPGWDQKLVCQRYRSKKRSFRLANEHAVATVPPMGNLGRSAADVKLSRKLRDRNRLHSGRRHRFLRHNRYQPRLGRPQRYNRLNCFERAEP